MTSALAYTSGSTDTMNPGELEPITDTSQWSLSLTDIYPHLVLADDEAVSWGETAREYREEGWEDVAAFCEWMSGLDHKPENVNETECLWQLHDDGMLPVAASRFPCLTLNRPDGYN